LAPVLALALLLVFSGETAVLRSRGSTLQSLLALRLLSLFRRCSGLSSSTLLLCLTLRRSPRFL
jgi:hypothetical protein